MIREIVDLVARLNLATHKNVIGAHFPEIVALLSIVFGGAFLLFGWKQHRYFLGVTGFLVGGWAGLLLKTQLAPGGGGVAPVLYLATCAVAGAFVATCWGRFVGILLGGFTIAVVGSVFFPSSFAPGDHALATMSMAFLLGGGLGAIFPKFFFIFNSSLIGSVFVTYGVSAAILSRVVGPVDAELQVLIHLCVFLPLLLFGMIYQLTTSQEPQAVVVTQAAPERAARASM
jgi:hypothetical protein